jgi:capsule polysaccharide export protein KpsE/RkpR
MNEDTIRAFKSRMESLTDELQQEKRELVSYEYGARCARARIEVLELMLAGAKKHLPS